MVVCGTVTILPAFEESAVSIVDCTTSADIAVEDLDTVSATATIENQNPVDASGTAEFLVGGATTEYELEIPNNDSVQITEDFIFQQPGEETIEIELGSFNRNDEAAPGR